MMRRQGMSLVELLVSLSIGTVVIAAVLGVLSSARRTQIIGEKRSELFQGVRVTLNQIKKDLQAAVLREEDEQFTFIGTNEMYNGLPSDTLEFSSASGAPMASLMPTGDLVRVQYYVDMEERTDRMGLVRSAIAMPLPEEIAPEQQDLSTREYCPWAVGLEMTYYDPNEETWVEEWEERTDMPTSVQVVMYVLPAEIEEDVESDIEDMMPFSVTVHLELAAAPIGTEQVAKSEQEPDQEGP
ncbi:MAG TPA: prepilin-type N-terminal cleavage/methylation domain-containing protein, partial [Armatimonadota bacterium]|nr:prepilin-type N-terminal cleavage/methylation domain-containing protein [Armatimonadota bacterium]